MALGELYTPPPRLVSVTPPSARSQSASWHLWAACSSPLALFSLLCRCWDSVFLSPLLLLSARRQPPLIFLSSEYERNIKRVRLSGGLFARRVIGSLRAQLDQQTHKLLTFCGVPKSRKNDGPQLPLVEVRWKKNFALFIFWAEWFHIRMNSQSRPPKQSNWKFIRLYCQLLLYFPTYYIMFSKQMQIKSFLRTGFNNVDQMFPKPSTPNF